MIEAQFKKADNGDYEWVTTLAEKPQFEEYQSMAPNHLASADAPSQPKTMSMVRKTIALIAVVLSALGMFAYIGREGLEGAQLAGTLVGGLIGAIFLYKWIAGPKAEKRRDSGKLTKIEKGDAAFHLLELGLFEEGRSNTEKAREVYSQLIKEYPDSDYAREAAANLKILDRGPSE